MKVSNPDSVYVVLGRGSKPEIELNLDNCIRDAIPIYQRDGGGCAVLIDPGNITVSTVLPVGGIRNNHMYFQAITDWLISALIAAGIRDVTRRSTSDLAVDNRKIGGSCIHRTRSYLYYTTTLLVDPNLDLIERYIAYPPREPDYRGGRSHRDFLGAVQTNLETSDLIDILSSKLDPLQLKSAVKVLFEGSFIPQRTS